jgi:predicted anti-sigma-YlaC factor YlaD
MFGAALTQVAVPLVAAAIWRPEVNQGMVYVLALNTIFAGIWAVSGWLFRRAGRA